MNPIDVDNLLQFNETPDTFNSQEINAEATYQDIFGDFYAVSMPTFIFEPVIGNLGESFPTGIPDYEVINGDAGNNLLRGGDTIDYITGLGGNDTLYGGAGFDILLGGSGKDRLYGGSGMDVLDGGSGKDRLYGGSGNDTLSGGSGNDILNGGKGNDALFGGSGKDILTGASGNDLFIFNKASETVVGDLRDVITDFQSGKDLIVLAGVDAQTGTEADDAFTFIGSEEFSAAGQLRFADGILSGNINADLQADFEIELVGVTSLSSSDFLA